MPSSRAYMRGLCFVEAPRIYSLCFRAQVLGRSAYKKPTAETSAAEVVTFLKETAMLRIFMMIVLLSLPCQADDSGVGAANSGNGPSGGGMDSYR